MNSEPTDEEREAMREELRAMCLQLGIHPHTFNNEEKMIDDAIARRKGVKQ